MAVNTNRSPSSTSVQLIKIIDEYKTSGSFGGVSGGELLKWMDITACAAAEKFAGESCVTLIMDDLSFSLSNVLKIFKPGDIVIVMAQVNRSYGSSMEVGVKVVTEELMSGIQKTACSAYFMFVLLKAKNEDGSKKTLPALVPQSDKEHRRYDLALDRREMRMERQKTIDSVTEVSSGSGDDGKNKVGKNQEESITEFTELILPIHANHMGNLFGGQAMAWMETAGFISATRHARKQVVVSSVDYIHFHKPAMVGDRVSVSSVVSRVFSNTHMEVMVSLKRHSLNGPKDELILTAFFIYSSKSTISDILPNANYLEEYKKALGREKVRLKRQILRNSNSLDLFQWTPELSQQPLVVHQLILKNLSTLLKLNEDAKGWTVTRKFPELTVSTAVLSKEITGVMLVGSLEVEVEKVVRMLDMEKRGEWDVLFKGGEVLEKIDQRNAVVRMIWQSESEKMQDMILLRSVKKGYAAKEYVIANISIEYPNAPKFPNYVRSQVLASGYILEKLAAKKTRMVSLFQFGGKALNLVKSDILPSLKSTLTGSASPSDNVSGGAVDELMEANGLVKSALSLKVLLEKGNETSN